MRCCSIKLKRSWGYCPGCGEEIEWPRKLPYPKQWPELDIEMLRMRPEPIETAINRIRSLETEILAGKVMGPVLEASIAHYAQQSLDILNMEGPFGPMVPEDQQIKMSREELVKYGKFLLKQKDA